MQSDIEKEAQARFKDDSRSHEMTIALDNGVYRHVRFRRKECSIYWFDLITWPGVLVINGDMGTWAFSRVNDMFDFFRNEKEGINPGYWGEKILSGSRSNNPAPWQDFDEESFKARVLEFVKDEIEDYPDLKEMIEDDVFPLLEEDNDGRAAMTALHDLDHEILGTDLFSGFWECNFYQPKLGYLWCLWAIVWGIKKYDEHKAEGK